jgi:hypothetical protein
MGGICIGANGSFAYPREACCMLPPFLTQELNRLLGNDWRASQVEHAGYSHSPVMAIQSPSGRWALKRLGLVSRERVLERHAFQSRLAEAPECRVPSLQRWSNGSTWIECDGFGWERSNWVGGSPLPRRGAVEGEQWEQVVESLVAMHRRSIEFSASEGRTLEIGRTADLPIGLRDRRTALRAWQRDGTDRWNSLATRLQRHVSNVHLAWFRPMAATAISLAMGAAESLEAMCRRPHSSYWIVRDCWRDHWLFSGKQLTGLIDFGAARLDWPGLDLVRCFGTLLGWPDDRWHSGLERVRRALPLCTWQTSEVLLIHRISVALSALQWLEWYGDGTFAPESIDGNRRLRELRDQLDELSASPLSASP